MNDTHKGICIVLAATAAVVLYYAMSQTDDNSLPIPQAQRESQMMGLGVRDAANYNKGTPLDMSPELHFWAPGWNNSGKLVDDHPTILTRHRYPAVSGGNISTILHKGWSACMDSAPAGNDWRLNPPEVAVL